MVQDPTRLDSIDVSELESRMSERLGAVRIGIEDPPLLDESKLEFELERAFWAAWSSTLVEKRIDAWRLAKIGTDYEYLVYTRPGGPVESRLNHLKITEDAGIGESFGIWTSDAEIAKFSAWGRTYVASVLPKGADLPRGLSQAK